MKGRYRLTKLSWGIIIVIISALLGLICYNVRSNIYHTILVIVYGILIVEQFIWIKIGDDTFSKLGCAVATNLICLLGIIIFNQFVNLTVGNIVGIVLGLVSMVIYREDIKEETGI